MALHQIISPLQHRGQRINSSQSLMSEADKEKLSIDELLGGDLNLCSPPEIFVRVNEALDDPHRNSRDIANIIAHDPGLSARLLRIANSPIYGLGGKVSSIAQAVTLLGHSNIRSLVLATVVVSRFSRLDPYGSVREYWRLCLRCALFAKHLATPMSMESGSAGLFIAGLLHDIGLLVFFQRLPELARAALMERDSEGISLSAAQQKLIGFDHYQVGARLSHLWQLPDIIMISIAYHDKADFAPAGYRRTCQLISLAHRLAEQDDEDPICLDIMQKLVLEEPAKLKLIHQAREEYDQIYSLFFGD